MKRALSGLLWLLILALPAAAAPVGAETALKAGAFTPARDAPDFSLRGSDGSQFTLSQYRGHVVLLVFGFTNCPAACPTTLAMLAQVRQKLGAAARQLQVVYVTVDPERDGTDVMRSYLAVFDNSFIGGTGKPDELAKIRSNYGVTATKVKMGDSYAMDHSTSVYLIDTAGKLRGMMPFGRPMDDYIHDVKLLIKG